MATLHVFNPSHDEALATNTPYYTPTAAARRLAIEYASLPTLWAAAGDFFLCSDNRVCRCGDLSTCLPNAHFWNEITSIEPWGWDALITYRLQRLGAPACLLPTAARLTAVRNLSSRMTAVRLLPLIRHDVPRFTVGQSAWCTTEAQVWSAVAAFGGTAMLKSPWSCSGRGVFHVVSPDVDDTATRGRIVRILQRQGAIEVEPFYRRVKDFALEFEADSAGDVRYVGLSCFSTSSRGDYVGNVVATEAYLHTELPATVCEVLPTVRNSLCLRLRELLSGNYAGPLGVDMMVVKQDNETLAIHPCVEVNVRRTMGYVALALRSHLPSAQSRLLFTLDGLQAME